MHFFPLLLFLPVQSYISSFSELYFSRTNTGSKANVFFAVTTMDSKCAVLLQKAMPKISEIRRGQVVETWYQ